MRSVAWGIELCLAVVVSQGEVMHDEGLRQSLAIEPLQGFGGRVETVNLQALTVDEFAIERYVRTEPRGVHDAVGVERLQRYRVGTVLGAQGRGIVACDVQSSIQTARKKALHIAFDAFAESSHTCPGTTYWAGGGLSVQCRFPRRGGVPPVADPNYEDVDVVMPAPRWGRSTGLLSVVLMLCAFVPEAASVRAGGPNGPRAHRLNAQADGSRAQSARVTEPRPIVDDDMAPALENDGDQSEFWNYHLFLGDGLRIHLSLFRSHLPFPVGHVVGCELSVLGLTDEPHTVVRRFSKDLFHWQAEPGSELRIHPAIGIRGSPTEEQEIFFATTKDGVRTELQIRLAAIENGLVHNDGSLVRSSEGRVVLLPLIARAQARGTVRIDDLELEVDGTAYVDHVYFTRRPHRLLEDVYQLIDHGDPWSVGVFYGVAGRAGGGRRGFWLTGGPDGASVAPVGAVDILERERFRDLELPTRVRIDAASGPSVLTSGTPDQRFSALDSVGGFTRFLFRTFVGGEVVLLRGTGERDGRPYAYTYFGID